MEPRAPEHRHAGMLRWTLAPVAVLMLLGGCVPATGEPSADATGTLWLEVVAGPVCPVERDPPDPACAPRPVTGAPILIQPADGRDIVVAQATTDAAGEAAIPLPAGDYLVLGGDVTGLMGRPEPTTVTIRPNEHLGVTLTYDTGIR